MPEVTLSSLSFTTVNKLEWNQHILGELLKECKSLMGVTEDFKTQGIYLHSNDRFVGGITFEQHGNILWIDSMWLDPQFRNQGHGKQLLEKAFHFATQNQLEEVQLNTFFEESHKFFLTCGFEDVAIIPNWKWGLACYFMRKIV